MPPQVNYPPCQYEPQNNCQKTEVDLESFKKSLVLFHGEFFDPNLNAAFGDVYKVLTYIESPTTEYNNDVQLVTLKLDI